MFCNKGATRWDYWLRCYLLKVIFILWICPTNGIDIQIIPSSPTIGQTALFNINGIDQRILSIDWYKGLNPSASNQIFNMFPPNQEINQGRAYFKNATGFINGSLKISDLRKEFEGNYTVQLQMNPPQQASVQLTVTVPSSPPDSPNHLGGGEIAGIVIAALCGTALLGFLGVMGFKKFKKDDII
ncbi:carcinoembryonic antigen-related cell adhesion molecule 8 [Bombina bombina]|uniref:carcinoembryonic antigen-related cell adhesion molecule 8 n=1 Tax=Bombina bombina TaxID=8345 RepID=UPI00235A8AC2|nr:carcinoembryonic antigen-related cell adhesion molecule 8 [Bombina bombina]